MNWMEHSSLRGVIISKKNMYLGTHTHLMTMVAERVMSIFIKLHKMARRLQDCLVWESYVPMYSVLVTSRGVLKTNTVPLYHKFTTVNFYLFIFILNIQTGNYGDEWLINIRPKLERKFRLIVNNYST
jgi:hypothetical protein